MARQEQDREDLLREAVALVERAEFRVSGMADSVVMGFRRDGSASVYFGGEPVYQFTSRGELRRAYDRGLLYKAERGRLVSLRRERLPGQVQLLRHDLTAEESSDLLQELNRRIAALRERIRRRDFVLVGQAPNDRDVLGRIDKWLTDIELPPRLAATPHTR